MAGHKEHHHGRKHRETGGANEAAEDLKTKNQRYTYESKVNNEAEERKHGGKVGKKHGAEHHHHSCKCPKCHGGMAKKHGGEAEHEKKHVGHVEGEHSKHHMGRAKRKSGGRTGADSHPFSSARSGHAPPGAKLDMEME